MIVYRCNLQIAQHNVFLLKNKCGDDIYWKSMHNTQCDMRNMGILWLWRTDATRKLGVIWGYVNGCDKAMLL